MAKYEKIVFGIMIFMGIGLVILLNLDLSPHKIKFEEDRIQIKIDNIYTEDIESISLLDEVLIGNKIKGTNTATYLRGTFQIEGDKKGKVYVYNNSKPYIRIATDEKIIIYNDKNSNETIETYNRLIKEYNLKEDKDSAIYNNSEAAYTQKNNIVLAIGVMPTVLIFVGIGVYSIKRKTPMHFWAGTVVKPEEISDIKAYNKANGIMWISCGLLFLLTPIIGGIAIAIFTPFMIVGMILCYKRIYNKYKVK